MEQIITLWSLGLRVQETSSHSFTIDTSYSITITRLVKLHHNHLINLSGTRSSPAWQTSGKCIDTKLRSDNKRVLNVPKI